MLFLSCMWPFSWHFGYWFPFFTGLLILLIFQCGELQFIVLTTLFYFWEWTLTPTSFLLCYYDHDFKSNSFSPFRFSFLCELFLDFFIFLCFCFDFLLSAQWTPPLAPPIFASLLFSPCSLTFLSCTPVLCICGTPHFWGCLWLLVPTLVFLSLPQASDTEIIEWRWQCGMLALKGGTDSLIESPCVPR